MSFKLPEVTLPVYLPRAARSTSSEVYRRQPLASRDKLQLPGFFRLGKEAGAEVFWLCDHNSSTELFHIPIHGRVTGEFFSYKLDFTRLAV